jgi:simple sugar transport system ATP-binding protein
MLILRELAKDGLAVLIVTHKLDEVMQVSDRVSVMRAGCLTGTWETASTTPALLVEEMIGHGRIAPAVRSSSDGGQPVLRISGLCVPGDRRSEALKGLDLQVRAGEIVGVAGVDGNGQEELADAIVAMRRSTAGTIHIGDVDVTRSTPVDILDLGVGYVPADRHRDGLILDFTVAENAVLVDHRLPKFSRYGTLSLRSMNSFAGRLIEEFSIKCDGPASPVRRLSGGNQQKLILGRELARNPALLVVVQPTRGLDVGAIDYVHSRLIESRNAGTAVLVISTEIDEILSLSDTVGVLREGKIVATVPRADATVEGIGRLMLSAPVGRAAN